MDKDKIQPKLVEKTTTRDADEPQLEGADRTTRVTRMARVTRLARVTRMARMTRMTRMTRQTR